MTRRALNAVMQLVAPTPEYARRRIAQFDGNHRYFGAEDALQLVFGAWPRNNRLAEVLAKTVILDRLYSTRIFNPWAVAEQIVSLEIDTRLIAGDRTLVHEIANTAFKGKPRYLLSFAAKYCAWHQPDDFQIFDSRVELMLWKYQQAFSFDRFRWTELRTYRRFVEIVDRFRAHFELGFLTRKQLDKFLWIEATDRMVQNTVRVERPARSI